MAKLGKSMSVASRLAAATALTGTLAACDGRFGRAADELFSPIDSAGPSEPVQRIAVPPAAPGNPVYVGGSRAANNELYQQSYGAPIQGSGQALSVPVQPEYATSVYQDSAITAQPVNVLPSYDAGAPISSGTNIGGYSSPQIAPEYSYGIEGYSTPLETPGAYGAPVQPVYNPPSSTSFPAIGSQPVYSPQSALPQSEMYTNASAQGGLRDIEPLLDFSPRAEPYGSSASVRYSVAEEALPTVDMTSRYAVAPPVLQSEPTVQTPAPSLETVEVASLDNMYVPMPRARPVRVDPVIEPSRVLEVAAASAPLPTVRPKMSRSPMPVRRPVQMASLSGKAITDAPPLTEAPKMIEVEPIFLDEPTSEAAPTVETAALAPPTAPSKDEPVSDTPQLVVIKPDDLKAEMAALDTSKIDTTKAEESIGTEESATAAPSVAADSSDLGDLKELSGTSWRLASLNGKDVAAEAELHFDGTSGFAGGQGICNNYGGEFNESLKGEFGMANIFTTETKCSDLALEKQYIVALETAKNYRMAPGMKELMLLGPDGKMLATFRAF